jgi:hypothetical protein
MIVFPELIPGVTPVPGLVWACAIPVHNNKTAKRIKNVFFTKFMMELVYHFEIEKSSK